MPDAPSTRLIPVRFDRSDRTRLLVEGRAPARMLHGVVTGSIPPDPVPLDRDAEGDEAGWWTSAAPESLVLTPRGRIVTDLRLLRLGVGDGGSFLLELPAAGRDPLVRHFARYLPPRFARVHDVSPATRMVTVVGEDAIRRAAEAAGLDPERVAALAPGDALLLGPAPGPDAFEAGGDRDAGRVDEEVDGFLALVRSGAVLPPALDLVGTPGSIGRIEAKLAASGVEEGSAADWQSLRIEKGTPETGQELGEDVLPPEAGLEQRAIDHRKGCYTGQEVIVRIRDRGKVNRHLRGLLMGSLPGPAPGTPLHATDGGKLVGEVRSSAESTRFGQRIGLGYVRREVAPGEVVCVGSTEGPEARVCALTEQGWEADPVTPLESGDPAGYS